jgi:hypothetical protein
VKTNKPNAERSTPNAERSSESPAGETLNVNVSTNETAATKPARLNALQTVADLSDRKLAFFHWREADELLDKVQHDVRDYGEEDTNFQPHDADEIEDAITKIIGHLTHVAAIARESGERTRAEIKRLAAETTKEGGAK